MTDARCLYTLLHAEREHHDTLLREAVAPIVREVRGHPALESLFFARYNKPDWHVRFRVLGEPSWIEREVRPRVERAAAAAREADLVLAVEYGEYLREYERYGGREGMRLAEHLFLHDTVAALDLLDADARGALEKTRREWSLLLTERFLDLLGFDRKKKIAVYRYAYSWAIDLGRWTEEELSVLGARYEGLRDGLLEVLRAEGAEAWGGEEPARIAERCLAASRPVVDEILAGHRAGRIEQDLVQLAWSYTHMHANRLGVDATAEAILRYFMHRLHEDGLA